MCCQIQTSGAHLSQQGNLLDQVVGVPLWMEVHVFFNHVGRLVCVGGGRFLVEEPLWPLGKEFCNNVNWWWIDCFFPVFSLWRLKTDMFAWLCGFSVLKVVPQCSVLSFKVMCQVVLPGMAINYVLLCFCFLRLTFLGKQNPKSFDIHEPKRAYCHLVHSMKGMNGSSAWIYPGSPSRLCFELLFL